MPGTAIEAALVVAMDEGTIARQPPRELAHLILAVLDEAALLIAHAAEPDVARANASPALGQLLEGLRVSSRRGGAPAPRARRRGRR